MKLIVILVAAALTGWWVWTSPGGGEGSAALPAGGPEPVIHAAQEASDAANESSRKLEEAMKNATAFQAE